MNVASRSRTCSRARICSRVWFLCLLLSAGCTLEARAPVASGPPPAQEPAAGAAVDEPRPGLGTRWGETRESSIRYTEFERAAPDQPAAVATVYYNDRDGIRAATGGAGFAAAGDRVDVAGGAVTVRLVDGWGRSLPVVESGGRHYVEGRDGDRYAIEIANRSGSRVEVVATVDGLDVIDGRPGSTGKRGYIVAPYATFAIDGFRRSQDEVAAFRFGSVSDSYAARTGDDRNVGIIGLAFFLPSGTLGGFPNPPGERGAPQSWFDAEARRRGRADPFPDRFASPPARYW